MVQATQRKYVLTKVAAGDYLLPSNDAKTIWRIARYTDGPSMGLDLPRDVEVWAVWRWVGGPSQVVAESVIDNDWSYWEMTASMLTTRKEAVEEVLRMSSKPQPQTETKAK